MATLIEQLITKMGLSDEPNVLEKTTELMRLLELRSTNVPLQINEYGKIVICGDLASNLLGIAFDKEQALKLSGLRKTQYLNNKRMFEKLLDLGKLATINDICVQLGLSEVCRKAEELLELYKRVVADQNAEIDIKHPQYATMAVYHACRLLKHKVSKTKLMPFSNLRPAQWQQLDLRWERIIGKHHSDNTTILKENHHQQQQQHMENNVNSKQQSKLDGELVAEDYEKWKSRMLAMARTKLAQSQEDTVTQ